MSAAELKTLCTRVAGRILYGNPGFEEGYLKEVGLEYRKGKTLEDIQAARARAVKADVFAKAEHLEEWLTLYLTQTLKQPKPNKKVP